MNFRSSIEYMASRTDDFSVDYRVWISIESILLVEKEFECHPNSIRVLQCKTKTKKRDVKMYTMGVAHIDKKKQKKKPTTKQTNKQTSLLHH